MGAGAATAALMAVAAAVVMASLVVVVVVVREGRGGDTMSYVLLHLTAYSLPT